MTDSTLEIMLKTDLLYAFVTASAFGKIGLLLCRRDFKQGK
jgi:hypothetical protein